MIVCARCGLPSTYPGTTFDADEVCNLCRSFETYQANVAALAQEVSA